MTAFVFGAIILFIQFGLSPVAIQTTSIMVIYPSVNNNHSVIFQVCAGDIIMRAPEVKIYSDSEEKFVRISEKILPNSCRQTSTIIKASDSTSIHMEKVDKENINIKITEVEMKIQKIQADISDRNAQLADLMQSKNENETPSQNLNRKVNEIAIDIAKLRIELQKEKNDHIRLLDLLNG